VRDERGSQVETRDDGNPEVSRPINGSERPDAAVQAADNGAILKAALTKEELQNLLFQNIGLSKRECRDMVNAIFEEMRAALEAGETVKLEGFGRFQPKDRPKRWARNLRSGERIPVSERRVVTFHPSRKLTEDICKQRGLDGKESFE
jgi:integration host factor subunit alpha